MRPLTLPRRRLGPLLSLSLVIAIGFIVGTCGGGGSSAAVPDTCPDVIVVPCQFQTVGISIPVDGTGLSLHYSSDRAPGRHVGPSDPDATDIGGWNVSLLDRLDVARGVFLGGDGSRRLVQAIAHGDQLLVASADANTVDVFDKNGREVRRIDALTKLDVVRFTYDGDQLTSITNSAGTTTFERNDSGTVTAIVSPLGGRTSVSIADANLIGLLDPTGRADRFAYQDGRLLTSWTNANGATTIYGYDGDGRVNSTRDPDGNETTYTRTQSGTTVTVEATRPGAAASKWTVEKSGEAWRYSLVTDGVATQSVEVTGDARHLTLGDGTKLDITLSPDPQWVMQAPLVAVHTTSPDGRSFDANEDRPAPGDDLLTSAAVSRKITIDGKSSVMQFTTAPPTVTNTTPEGRTTTLALGDFERVMQFQAPGTAPIAYAYDETGRPLSVTQGLGAGARASNVVWDTAANQANITDAIGATSSVSFDGQGNPQAFQRADGQRTVVDLSGTGTPIGVSVDGEPVFTLGTNNAGQLTSYAPVDGTSFDVTSFTYDGGRLTGEANPDGTSAAYSYDSMGRLAAANGGGGEYAPVYAASGIVSGWQLPDGETETRTLDGNVALGTALAGPVAGEINVERDGAGRITSLAAGGGPRIPLGYDSDQLLTTIGDLVVTRDPASGRASSTQAGVVSTTTSYDEFGALKDTSASGPAGALFAETFGRDLLGRITTETDTFGGQASQLTYSYDAAGRLSQASRDGQALVLGYDNRDNVTSLTGSQTASFSIDRRNQLTSDGTSTYEWTSAGTLRSIKTGGQKTTLTFDGIGQLTDVQSASGQRIHYLYDASGRRIGRTVDGVLDAGWLYLPDSTLPLAQVDAAGKTVATFAYAGPGAPAEMLKDGRTYRIVSDHLGSPRLVVDDASGQIAEQLDYDVFGRVVSDTNPGFQPFGYAGGLLDPATGFVRLGVRDYDPAIARWTSRDPAFLSGGQANLYEYARDDWVNLVDRSGRAPIDPAAEAAQAEANRAAGANLLSVLSSILAGSGTVASAFGAGSVAAGGAGAIGLPVVGAVFGAVDVGLAVYNIQTSGVNGSNLADLMSGIAAILASVAPFAGPLAVPLGVVAAALYVAAIFTKFDAHGDPHFHSLDGNLFDFQGAGEYVLAHDPGGGFDVQARQEPRGDSRLVSVITAVSVGLGGGHRVAIYRGRKPELLVDGGPVDLGAGSFDVGGEGRVTRLLSGEYLIATADGNTVVEVVPGSGDSIKLAWAVDAARGARLQGLGGSLDGNAANDFTTRDGIVLQNPGFDAIHHQFGESWRISQAESLFDYDPGKSTETYTDKTFPAKQATVDDVPAEARTKAETVCRGAGITDKTVLANCILDVGLLRDPSFAAQSVDMNASLVAAGLGARPSAVKIQTFSVQIGSKVGPDSPVAGAGKVDGPNVTQQYQLAGSGGDAAYLAALPDCQPSGIEWQVRRPDGSVLGGISDICQDIGRVVFDTAGMWTIAVSSPSGATGTYGFSIEASEADQRFTVSPDSSVSEGQPGPGAGSIDKPGGEDFYQISGAAGDVVFLAALKGCSSAGVRWQLHRPDGSMSGGIDSVCSDLGRITFDTAGTWTVQVTADGAQTGPYGFDVIRSEPLQRFSVAFGSSVRRDQPGPGAGHIDKPGGEDRYEFTATSGGRAVIAAAGSCTPSGLQWHLERPNGSTFGGIADICADIGDVTFDAEGVWVIVVTSNGNHTGDYGFDLRSQ